MKEGLKATTGREASRWDDERKVPKGPGKVKSRGEKWSLLG